jgi:hypothetical protein
MHRLSRPLKCKPFFSLLDWAAVNSAVRAMSMVVNAATICTSTANSYRYAKNPWRKHATQTQCCDESNCVYVAQFLVFTRDADSWGMSRTYFKIWVGCAAGELPQTLESLFSGSMEYFLVTALRKIDKSDNRCWHKCVFFLRLV